MFSDYHLRGFGGFFISAAISRDLAFFAFGIISDESGIILMVDFWEFTSN